MDTTTDESTQTISKEEKAVQSNRGGLIAGIVILVLAVIAIIVVIALAYTQPCIFEGTLEPAIDRLIQVTREYPNELIQVDRQQALAIIQTIRQTKFKNSPNCANLPQQVEQFARLCAPSGYRALCDVPANQQPQFDPGCNIVYEIPPEGVNGTACRIIQQRPVYRA